MKVTSISMLIDSPIEEVKEYLDEAKLPLGSLVNLKKGLEMEFQRVTHTKNQLIQVLKLEQDTKKVDTLTGNITQLYIALQLIEDRATLFQSYINEIKAKKI